MRKMQIHHPPRGREDLHRALPLDPRDPEVLRAKQLNRTEPQAPDPPSR
jgi:hypothetical protein